MSSIFQSVIVYAAINPPQITWVPSSEIQMWSTRAAFVIGLIWLLYLIMQFVVPGRRQQGGLGRGGAVKFIGAAVVIIVLMDLNLVPVVINNAMTIIWYIGDLIGIRA